MRLMVFEDHDVIREVLRGAGRPPVTKYLAIPDYS